MIRNWIKLLGQAHIDIKLNTSKDNVLEGRVSEIQGAFDETSQSFICKITLDQQLPTELNIYGTPLECNILVGEKKKALLIPREYLGYGNNVSIKGQKEMIRIKTGIVSTDFVEVLEGIDQNVVILPIKN